MRPQPIWQKQDPKYRALPDCWWWRDMPMHDIQVTLPHFAPVLPGQEFWMPETWYDNLFNRSDEQKESREDIYYRADGLPDFEGEENEIRWSPSTNMPQWAARTFGKARTARIGRVQEATPLDAWNEGCRLGASIPWEKHIPELQKQCRLLLKRIWDAEHPRDPWVSNCWTWIVELERSKA